MRLSRKKAIELCIELWTYLARYGKEKEDWPRWEKYKKYGHFNKYQGEWFVNNHCWFCEYSQQKSNCFDVDCYECPLPEDGDDIEFRCEVGSNRLYYLWNTAKTSHTRKKYAKLFLEQIKAIPIRRQKK